MTQLRVSVSLGTLDFALLTMISTFSAPNDYEELSQILTFSGSSTEQTVTVTINDDNLLEVNEVFRATLEILNVVADQDSIVLQPAEISVIILDEDSECTNPDTFSVEL